VEQQRGNDAVLVCGSANWNKEDRYLSPDQLHPVVVRSGGQTVVCEWFDQFKNPGVGAILFDSESSFLMTTGFDLIRVDTATGVIEELTVDGLNDVHELTMDGDHILVSNTGTDEVLALTRSTGEVIRYDLDDFRVKSATKSVLFARGHFHLNQAFRTPSDELLVLAHHTDGYRAEIKKKNLLVRHGSGGIVNVETGWRKNLGLRAPHSVRLVDKDWMVVDSGRSEMVSFDLDWNELSREPLSGFGRGVAITEGVIYVGISAIRRRYAAAGDNSQSGLDCIDQLSRLREFIPLPMMEQVNSVVALSPMQLTQLQALA